jgi:flagellar motor switch protein FliM
MANNTRISSTEEEGGLLSQEEINALLQKAELYDNAKHNQGLAQHYDFTSPNQDIRGLIFSLEMVNERFARYFRVGLFNLLRHYSEISLSGIQVLKFGEYTHSLPTPISVNLFRVKPIGGMALLIFDLQLVMTVVDVFFGGGRFRTKLEKSNFTAAESRIIQMMAECALHDLKQAWNPVMPLEFEYLSSEIDPRFASVITSGDIVVVAMFHVSFEGIDGKLHVVFPYPMLVPLRKLLTAPVQSKGLETDQQFLNALQEGMKEVEVEVSCVLAETSISLDELVRLKPGDVIPIDIPEKVALQVEKVPMYWCKYGVVQDTWAVKVIEPTDNRFAEREMTDEQ